jgi:ABC-type transport system involved in multi-copper enzyme maturation permease subunit
MSPAVLIARKEAGELLLSLRGLAWLMAVSVALSVFVLLLVSDTELSLLDNAQAIYDMVGIVTALGGLLALVVGVDAVAGERERGSLVPLLLSPASRGAILAGKAGGGAIAWLVMYAVALPYLWAVGSTGQNLWQAMLLLALLGSPVVLGFALFGIALGVRLASARSALMAGLIVLVVSASPLLIGPSLRRSAVGQIFDAVNPFSAAVNAYDAVIIDSHPLAAQWPYAAVALAWLIVGLWLARSALRHISP